MELSLSNVLPYPLKEMEHHSKSFWNAGTLQFQQGEVYEIIAPSGRGKTTLLDILFGKRKDFDGSYAINGSTTNKLPLKQWAALRRAHISYVFQGLRLFKHLTGVENIALKNRLTGCLSDNDITSMAGKLAIADQLHKKAGLMSFGQQQRLALIRALAQPFDWLLLDEPFSHIDRETAEVAADLITSVCREKGAGCIVTRLGNESFITADHQIVL
jgi:putative ABC transport system ATP-binding protein